LRGKKKKVGLKGIRRGKLKNKGREIVKKGGPGKKRPGIRRGIRVIHRIEGERKGTGKIKEKKRTTMKEKKPKSEKKKKDPRPSIARFILLKKEKN